MPCFTQSIVTDYGDVVLNAWTLAGDGKFVSSRLHPAAVHKDRKRIHRAVRIAGDLTIRRELAEYHASKMESMVSVNAADVAAAIEERLLAGIGVSTLKFHAGV